MIYGRFFIHVGLEYNGDRLVERMYAVKPVEDIDTTAIEQIWNGNIREIGSTL